MHWASMLKRHHRYHMQRLIDKREASMLARESMHAGGQGSSGRSCRCKRPNASRSSMHVGLGTSCCSQTWCRPGLLAHRRRSCHTMLCVMLHGGSHGWRVCPWLCDLITFTHHWHSHLPVSSSSTQQKQDLGPSTTVVGHLSLSESTQVALLLLCRARLTRR